MNLHVELARAPQVGPFLIERIRQVCGSARPPYRLQVDCPLRPGWARVHDSWPIPPLMPRSPARRLAGAPI